MRWWNVLHPSAYAQRIAAGRSPAHAREVLDDETRLADGLHVAALSAAGRAAAVRFATDGLVERGALEARRVVLTRRGRLLAEAVVRELVD